MAHVESGNLEFIYSEKVKEAFNQFSLKKSLSLVSDIHVVSLGLKDRWAKLFEILHKIEKNFFCEQFRGILAVKGKGELVMDDHRQLTLFNFLASHTYMISYMAYNFLLQEGACVDD